MTTEDKHIKITVPKTFLTLTKNSNEAGSSLSKQIKLFINGENTGDNGPTLILELEQE